MKRYLSVLLSVLMLLTMLPLGAIVANAEGEYFTITENNRNLFLNVDQEVKLSDISVSLNGVAVPGNDVIWTASDAEVSIGGGILSVSAKGIFVLDVEDAEGNYGTVTVITKNADEAEYVLYEEDFEAVANGTLPEGWTEAENADVVADEAIQATFPNYIANAQVIDGKLYIGNGYNTGYNYVWLPEFLDSFGDYRVTVDMAQTWAYNNMRAGGIVTRGDRTDAGAHPAHGYRIFIRRSTTGSDGMRLTSLARIDNATNKTDAKLPFPIGSTRAWSRPDWTGDQAPEGTEPNPWFTPAVTEGTDWKGEGYYVTWEVTNSGSQYTLDAYKSFEQPQFGGDMGPNNGDWWQTYHLKGDPALEGYEMDVDTTKWDPADLCETGAIGLFTSGVQLAVESIKVTVPANILAANPDKYTPTELDPSLAVYQSQKIGVMSDIHLQTGSTAGDYALKAALTNLKNEGVSAVLFTGDLVNTGVAEEYEKFNNIWNEVMGDTDTKMLTITGNHEFEGVYFRGETYEQVLQAYLDAFGKTEANFHEVVNGIHIIGLNSESHVVDGSYTLDSMMYLEEQLAEAAAADPYAPIIVMCHQTLANTTYGSNWGSSGTGSLYEVLRYYPQVIYLAGHSHFDFTNDKSIMQKDFTCIDVPSMQYTSAETDNIFTKSNVGSAAACYTYQNYLILEIDGESKTMDVKRMKSYDKNDGNHSYETVQVKDAWTLNLPLSKKGFTYTAARADERVAPEFAADANITLGNVTSNSVNIKFPAATHSDYVHAYNITVTDAAGEALVSKYFVSDFYELGAKKTEYEMDLEGLPSNTKCIVNVSAIESYGKTSEAISAEFTTEAISTPSVSYNRADFLDVNTAVGFVDASPYRRAYSLYVRSHPIKLFHDEELGRQVAFMKGWVNYPVSQGNLKDITNSFTVEVAFKTPAEEITAGQCLFGNPESGGLTVEYTANGVFQVGAYIQDAEGKGGYVYVPAPALDLNTWYHITYTFDGQKSCLYLNGELVGEKESVGTVKYNSAVNFLTIGANVNAAGNAAYTYQGHIALARVYTQAMDAAGAADAYYYYLNDNAYNAVYQKQLALKNLVNLDEADAAYAAETIAALDAVLASKDLTEDKAAEIALEINKALDKLAVKYGDPDIGLTLFEDAFDDFTKVHTSDAYNGLQWENNTEIKKTLVSKQNNASNYSMIYKLPYAVRRIELDALGVSVYDKDYFSEDFTIYVSKDGEDWIYVPATISDPVDNTYTNYWREATLTSEVTGEYNYVKVQLNMFGKAIDENGEEVTRVNWAAVMDGIRIWTEELVVSTNYGDLDGNGTVNLVDAALLQRYVNNWDVNIDLIAADYDADGEINNKDLVALIRYLNGWGEPERPDDELQACQHEYDDEYDPECNLCKEIREVPDKPVVVPPPALPENPYDPLDNLTVAIEAVGLENFGNHPEMGKSVAMRAPATLADGESYLIYQNEGKVATAIEVGGITLEGWGFDLAVSGRAADGEWVALEYTTTDRFDIGASNPSFQMQVATVTVPEGITEIKVAMTNTGAAWTFALDYVDIAWAEPTAVKVYDDLNGLDAIAVENAGLENFGNHPEMGQSVAMRAPAALADGESYLIYQNEGMGATAIEVGGIAMDGWGFDLAVFGRNGDGEWVNLEYTTTDRADIGCSNPAFKGAVATVIVPEQYAEIKVAMTNTGAAWTFALNYVEITWDIVPTYVTITDDLNGLGAIAVENAGLENFGNHPEMGQSVAMRAPASLADGESYLIYKKEGMGATAIEVGGIVLDGWGFDLAVFGRHEGGEWVALEYTTTDPADIGASNPGFKGAIATVNVPEQYAEIKVAMTNTGAAWTFALNYVSITWDVLPTYVIVNDELNGLGAVAVENAGLENFGNHPEMGQSVAMRAPASLADGESYLIYKNEGMVATAIVVDGIALDGWGFDLAVFGRNGEGEWVAMEYTTTDRVDIGASNPGFKGATATVNVTENFSEIKVAMTNTGAAWTFALNNIAITWDIA